MVVFIIVEVQQIFADRDHKILSTAEIKRRIQTKYLGDIKDIKLNKEAENKIYVVDLHGQDRVYTLKADAFSGEILYLNQKEEASENLVNIENEEIASFSFGEKEDKLLVKSKTSFEDISLDCSVKVIKAKKS
jgi:hypothetical protein